MYFSVHKYLCMCCNSSRRVTNTNRPINIHQSQHLLTKASCNYIFQLMLYKTTKIKICNYVCDIIKNKIYTVRRVYAKNRRRHKY
jgi:hypothetical protein